ncbi:J domain-containing protein [Dyella japonica]|uniref:J domain-containing protein n=1 Tax=Dyella japonica TaxID=231455 RepID=UPI0005842B9C|nr:J domain-containing protein [Dyella japonica]
MTHETDFLDLYRRLGLDPGCQLDELKQAYRRKMAVLHPDRQLGKPVDVHAAARLQRITAQYSAAMDFHRRHGRLPGAPLSTASAAVPGHRVPTGATPETPDPFAARRDASSHAKPRESARAPLEHRSHTRLAVLLAITALASLGWALYRSPVSPSEGTDESAAMSGGNVLPEPAPTGAVLHLGMSTDDVRAIEGEPLAVHGDLWEYGPSWVRFEHDDVVDWHSSPLRPLHTDTGPAAGL